jgi:hypothetical protein
MPLAPCPHHVFVCIDSWYLAWNAETKDDEANQLPPQTGHAISYTHPQTPAKLPISSFAALPFQVTEEDGKSQGGEGEEGKKPAKKAKTDGMGVKSNSSAALAMLASTANAAHGKPTPVSMVDNISAMLTGQQVAQQVAAAMESAAAMAAAPAGALPAPTPLENTAAPEREEDEFAVRGVRCVVCGVWEIWGRGGWVEGGGEVAIHLRLVCRSCLALLLNAAATQCHLRLFAIFFVPFAFSHLMCTLTHLPVSPGPG